tara:strand:+ start:528 stop:698 length:171 start_codon:yes stop_codon:yes gene_type:complete
MGTGPSSVSTLLLGDDLAASRTMAANSSMLYSAFTLETVVSKADIVLNQTTRVRGM